VLPPSEETQPVYEPFREIPELSEEASRRRDESPDVRAVVDLLDQGKTKEFVAALDKLSPKDRYVVTQRAGDKLFDDEEAFNSMIKKVEEGVT
jgi:DNA-directed RNA polymerase specialized sigma24 family protein